MLALEAIHTYYGDSHILHGVSLEVQPGELVARIATEIDGYLVELGQDGNLVWLQLEELTASIRLVADLPPPPA